MLKDKELFELLEQSTDTGCWSYSLEKDELWWSKKTYDLHKVSYETKLDVSMGISFYHPEDQKLITELFQACVKDGVIMNGQFRVVDTKKNEITVEVFGKPVKNSSDEIVGVFGTFKNITVISNIKKESEHLDWEFSQLRDMLDEFFIVAETDEKGVITYVNDNFCKISHYTKEELIGETHRIVNSHNHPRSFFAAMWKKIVKGEVWEGLICNRGKNGQLYWVHTYIMPKFELGKNLKITGYISLRFDVTDRVLLEKELAEEKSRQEMSSQLATLGEMSAGIAHEIANPLSIINVSCDVLLKDSSELEKRLKYLNKISNSSDRIAKIINGLHHLAQKSRGGKFEVRNIEAIVNLTFEFCVEALRSRGINISYEKKSEECFVECDEVRISQILLNLISNSRDAIGDLKEKWIKIVQDKDENYVYLSVIDSGKGIPKEIAKKVLEKFYTTKKVGKGTGLGLYLVKRFVDDHKGKLEIVTESPNTEFRVTLPRV